MTAALDGTRSHRDVAPSTALGALARTLEMWTGRGINLEPDRGGASHASTSDDIASALRRQNDIRLASGVALPRLETMLSRGERACVCALWYLYVHRGVDARSYEVARDEEAEWVGYICAPSVEQLAAWNRARGKVSGAGARRLGERVTVAATRAWESAAGIPSTSDVRRPWISEISAHVQRRVVLVGEVRRKLHTRRA